jgi:hypothetical protein
MEQLLNARRYQIREKDEPTGRVKLAFPVDPETSEAATGPIFEFVPDTQWWRRRGYSIVC